MHPGPCWTAAGQNRYAFTGYATDVVIKNLTIQNFGRAPDATTTRAW